MSEYQSEFAQVVPYGGKPPVKDDDPNEHIPTEWPGAPRSADEWNGWTAEQQADSIKRQVDALIQFQFNHVLFTDRILIDGAVPEGFQPNENGRYTRRFTTSAGIPGKLGLEPGQPTAVVHDAPAPAPTPAADPTREAQVHAVTLPWGKSGEVYTYREATNGRVRGDEAVNVLIDIPQDTPDDGQVYSIRIGEFNAPPQLRGYAVWCNDVPVVSYLTPGNSAQTITFVVGTFNPHGAMLTLLPGRIRVLIQNFGSASEFGDMGIVLERAA